MNPLETARSTRDSFGEKLQSRSMEVATFVAANGLALLIIALSKDSYVACNVVGGVNFIYFSSKWMNKRKAGKE